MNMYTVQYIPYVLTFLSRAFSKSLAVDQLERPADLYKDHQGRKEDEIGVTLVFHKQMVRILIYVLFKMQKYSRIK